MTMVQTMKIEAARAAVALIFVLHKLKIISEKRYKKLVNHITVRTLKHQMEESNGKPNP